MKYYSEDEMKGLRLAVEEEVLSWPHVRTNKMFGCPCYRAKGTLFVFLFMDSIVITRLSEKDREKISSQRRTMAFEAANKKIPKWTRIPMQGKRGLDKLMPYVRKSYEAALMKKND